MLDKAKHNMRVCIACKFVLDIKGCLLASNDATYHSHAYP